ncbi:cation-translocating P-type ATPase [Flaviaesturariibacter terrae]
MKQYDTASRSDDAAPLYTLAAGEALDRLQSSVEGLSEAEATSRQRRFGANTLRDRPASSALQLLLAQFKSPITLLLIAAALLSWGLHESTEAIIILVIVLLSSLLGFWQEHSAANAVRGLLQLVQVTCRLRRREGEADRPVHDLVPGDVLLLSAGAVIPADCLLIDSNELYVDEAAFTGESFPVEKQAGALPAATPLAKRSNMVYMGAHVISGRATVLVVATGAATEFGALSAKLRLRPPETEFEKGIRQFGYLLMQLTLLLVIIIFVANVWLHKPVIDSFLFSLALAVGLTPQLLPAIIAVNLATGARRMAQKQVIVKRLSSIENLGSMNILCSDKTGTITSGEVRLKDALNIDGGPSQRVLQLAWLNASLQLGFHNPIDEAITKAGTAPDEPYAALREVPYDFLRKRLSIQVHLGNRTIAISKGALAQVLDVCTQAEMPDGSLQPLAELRAGIEARFREQSENGLRTLGIAWKLCAEGEDFDRSSERDMIFLGFLTLYDPLKPGVAETIASLRQLGVQLKLITGDNALVARSLGRQIGLQTSSILTGSALHQMSNAALLQQVQRADIFAEVEPNQKETIILALKKAGNVVGFLGDGINDAAALHAAEVGISVNTAVDVAREAADMVLLDRDLEVLADGITEGRRTFANTMKYVFMATSANFGNMFSMAGASLFLPFLPLLPKQVLITNLLTDLPETTIATDRVDAAATANPQPWDLGFIRRFMVLFGLLSSLFDYLTFGALLWVLHVREADFRTGWFIESVISASLIVLVVRTRDSFYRSRPSRYMLLATLAVIVIVLLLPVTPLAPLLGFTKLPPKYYTLMAGIVAAYVFSAEALKRWFYRREWSRHKKSRLAMKASRRKKYA